jgi:putative phosphoribosyl transferase
MHYAGVRPLVLALPRGGVPVAYEVAKALQAPLDLVMVRKIGAPGHPEYGVGAVVDGAEPQIVLDEEVIARAGIPEHLIDAETRRQLHEIERRRRVYTGNRAPVPVKGRTVIVVDDGIATGNTVRAALAALRLAGAEHIVLAVPVAPPEAVARLREQVDELVCLDQPTPFVAVGLHYADFDATSDGEVVDLLSRAAEFGREPLPATR